MKNSKILLTLALIILSSLSISMKILANPDDKIDCEDFEKSRTLGNEYWIIEFNVPSSGICSYEIVVQCNISLDIVTITDNDELEEFEDNETTDIFGYCCDCNEDFNFMSVLNESKLETEYEILYNDDSPYILIIDNTNFVDWDNDDALKEAITYLGDAKVEVEISAKLKQAILMTDLIIIIVIAIVGAVTAVSIILIIKKKRSNHM